MLLTLELIHTDDVIGERDHRVNEPQSILDSLMRSQILLRGRPFYLWLSRKRFATLEQRLVVLDTNVFQAPVILAEEWRLNFTVSFLCLQGQCNNLGEGHWLLIGFSEHVECLTDQACCLLCSLLVDRPID